MIIVVSDVHLGHERCNKDGFDYSFYQCTLTTCVYPEWKCPCDSVANLGGVQNEKNQILT